MPRPYRVTKLPEAIVTAALRAERARLADDTARLKAELASLPDEAALRRETALHEAMRARLVAFVEDCAHCTFAERRTAVNALVARHVVALHRAGFRAAASRTLREVAVASDKAA